MKKAYWTLFYMIGVLSTAPAQDYNQLPEFIKANSVWAFGDSVGIDFNSGTPTPFESHISTAYSSASVADPQTGELLFYAGDGLCYNRNHEVMPNGSGLLPNTLSTTQGGLIVPVIDSPGKYYLFNLSPSHGDPSSASAPPLGDPSLLTYSIINMESEGGLGDVESGQKNIPVDTVHELSESMIAIPGNHCDIWVLLHTTISRAVSSTDTTSYFVAYHITRDGVDPNPVVSHSGAELSISFTQNYGFKQGTLAVSPNREMIALTTTGSVVPWPLAGLTPLNLGILLAKFDTETGIVSDGMWITNRSQNYVCFSPDNSKLYSVSMMSGNDTVYQFNVSNYDSAAIASSVTPVSGRPGYRAALKLYNDTIYIRHEDKIDRINKPNEPAATCDYESNVMSFPSMSDRAKLSMELPAEVVYPMPADTFSSLAMDSTFCSELALGVSLRPTVVSDVFTYEWDNGSTDTTRKVTGEGNYWVLYTDGCKYYVDSFVVEDASPEPVIRINEFELSTTIPYERYQWLRDGNSIPDATEATYMVTENGDYQVVVTNAAGCIDTSAVYPVSNSSIDGQQQVRVALFPNPTTDLVNIQSPVDLNLRLYSMEGRLLIALENSKRISLGDLADGIYFLQVYDQRARLIKTVKLIKQ